MNQDKPKKKKIVTKSEPQDKGKGLVGETHKNVNRIMAIENKQRQEFTAAEKAANLVAKFCGSMTFVWVHIIWFSAWIVVNTTPQYAFDPFPFTFLTLVVSLEAIFLSTFILISQNQEGRLTERRNHLDLQINLLAEQENTKMLEILAQIAEKVGVSIEDDPAVRLFEEDMEPDKLVKQILKATDGNADDGKKEK